MSAGWTDEMIAALREGVAAGESGGNLAKRLSRFRPGITRNAVIGKANRLGLLLSRDDEAHRAHKRSADRLVKVKRAKPAPPAPKAIAAPSAAPNGKRADPPWLPKVKSSAPLEPLSADVWAPLPGVKPCRLIDLDPDGCRWPVDGEGAEHMMFCGAPGAAMYEARPYCAAHAAAERQRARKQRRGMAA